MARPTARRVALLAGLVSLLALAIGCPPITEEQLRAWRDEDPLGAAIFGSFGFLLGEGPIDKARDARRKKPEPLVDRFIGFAGLAPGGFGFVVAPRPLRVPFTVELRGGVLIPDSIPFSDGLLWCLELDFRTQGGTSLDTFYLLCGNTGLGGITAFASVNGINLPGSAQFPGVFELDLQVEADGTEMIFRARAHDPTGTAPWMEVDRTPYDGTPGPLYPSVGASNVGQGAFAGFDFGRVVANGAPPPGQTPEEAAAEALWQAVEHQFEALYRVDGLGADFAAALAQLDLAVADAEAALALVEGVADKKLRKKARKQLKKSRKGILKTRKKLEKERIQKAVDKALKTLGSEIRAFQLLTPFALR